MSSISVKLSHTQSLIIYSINIFFWHFHEFIQEYCERCIIQMSSSTSSFKYMYKMNKYIYIYVFNLSNWELHRLPSQNVMQSLKRIELNPIEILSIHCIIFWIANCNHLKYIYSSNSQVGFPCIMHSITNCVRMWLQRLFFSSFDLFKTIECYVQCASCI